MKKILLALVIVSGISLGSVKPDMDPFTVTGAIIWGTACAAGGLVVATGVESYNILSQDNTPTGTMDTTLTSTNEGN